MQPTFTALLLGRYIPKRPLLGTLMSMQPDPPSLDRNFMLMPSRVWLIPICLMLFSRHKLASPPALQDTLSSLLRAWLMFKAGSKGYMAEIIPVQ
jgi:hypothetical protein